MAEGDKAEDKVEQAVGGTAGKVLGYGVKGAKLVTKVSAVMLVFSLAANPAGAATLATAAQAANAQVAAEITAGTSGVFKAGWDAVAFGVTNVVPYAWSGTPETLNAVGNTATWGANGLAEGAQWVADLSKG